MVTKSNFNIKNLVTHCFCSNKLEQMTCLYYIFFISNIHRDHYIDSLIRPTFYHEKTHNKINFLAIDLFDKDEAS